MEKKEKTGLVLEGGGMRGMYTAGVLDVWMEQKITFDGLMGVSAGALIGSSYASGQHGRSIRYYCKYAGDERFMGWKNFFRTGDFVGNDFGYHEIPEHLDPFDYEAFRQNPMAFYVVCTDMYTGKPVYLKIQDMAKQIDMMRASATLPYIDKPVEMMGMRLLDGGCSDSIPLEAMRGLGYGRNVVVLTRDAGYRKKAGAWWLPGNVYKRYPEFARQLRLRFVHYNRCVRMVEKLADKGEIVLIRPSRPLKIGRMEGNPEKLRDIYEIGRYDAEQSLDQVRAFLDRKVL